MRITAPLVLFALCALWPWKGPGAADSSYKEPKPHWATLTAPYDDTFFDVRIGVPAGHSLCGIADGYSNWQFYFVLLDGKRRCEDLKLETNWEEIGDLVFVAPFMDTSTTIETLEQYVQRTDDVFCSVKRHAASSGIGPMTASRVPATSKKANVRVLGLETVACTREDAGGDRYSKAYLAYQSAPGALGYGVTLGAYVRLQNKQAADRLLDQIATLLQPLPQ